MWRDSFFPEPAEAALDAAPSLRADGAPAIGESWGPGGHVQWRSTRWTPDRLGQLVAALARGRPRLLALPVERLVSAWRGAVDELRHPSPGSEAEALRAALANTCRLSPAGLDAGLDSVLDGVSTASSLALFEQTAHRLADPGDDRPVWVVLSSNLPGLAAQSLLPALASRRPVLVKSASAEPLFAPYFVESLCRREPVLRQALAAAAWPGGRADLEAPVLDGVGRVVAYGGGQAMADLRRRAGSRLVAHGPKISLAIVDGGIDGGVDHGIDGGTKGGFDGELDALARGLAHDIALFDQRGCLSVQAIYCDAPPEQVRELARRLASALGALAERWPPGPAELETLAAVREARDEAIMRGVEVFPASLPASPAALENDAGGVLLDPAPALRPAPGRRWVRLHAVADLAHVPEQLAAWRGRLQGVAVAGPRAEALEDAMRGLGVSHVARPGALQSPDLATWANGGVAPLDAFLF